MVEWITNSPYRVTPAILPGLATTTHPSYRALPKAISSSDATRPRPNVLTRHGPKERRRTSRHQGSLPPRPKPSYHDPVFKLSEPHQLPSSHAGDRPQVTPSDMLDTVARSLHVDYQSKATVWESHFPLLFKTQKEAEDMISRTRWAFNKRLSVDARVAIDHFSALLTTDQGTNEAMSNLPHVQEGFLCDASLAAENNVPTEDDTGVLDAYLCLSPVVISRTDSNAIDQGHCQGTSATLGSKERAVFLPFAKPRRYQTDTHIAAMDTLDSLDTKVSAQCLISPSTVYDLNCSQTSTLDSSCFTNSNADYEEEIKTPTLLRRMDNEVAMQNVWRHIPSRSTADCLWQEGHPCGEDHHHHQGCLDITVMGKGIDTLLAPWDYSDPRRVARALPPDGDSIHSPSRSM